MRHWQLQRLGEDGLLLQLGTSIDAALNTHVHALNAQIQAQCPAWLRDSVPGYSSLALFLNEQAFAHSQDPLQTAETWLHHLLQAAPLGTARNTSRCVEIPVHYGGEAGPDLAFVAERARLSSEEVIHLHCSAEYRVAMLGFSPGFPYLLGLDPRLTTPRRSTPRTLVPAGSIAIGGAQTGLYPQASPGGWNLIGRTALALFDPQRAAPSLLAPGDRVRFIAINGT